MDQRDIQQLLDAGLTTSNLQTGDILLIARPNNQRGDNYSILAINKSDLANALSPPSSDVRLLVKKVAADLNTTADQAITLSGGSSFIITDVVVTNASRSINTAKDLAIYTGKNRSGYLLFQTVVVGGADQALPDLALPTNFISVAIGFPAGEVRFYNSLPGQLIGTDLYLSLLTPQGSPATADVYIYGYVVK